MPSNNPDHKRGFRAGVAPTVSVLLGRGHLEGVLGRVGMGTSLAKNMTTLAPELTIQLMLLAYDYSPIPFLFFIGMNSHWVIVKRLEHG